MFMNKYTWTSTTHKWDIIFPKLLKTAAKYAKYGLLEHDKITAGSLPKLQKIATLHRPHPAKVAVYKAREGGRCTQPYREKFNINASKLIYKRQNSISI